MRVPTWRAEKVKGNKAMAYGNDHAMGKFIMIWTLEDPTKPTDWIPNQPDDDNLIVDQDEFLGTLTEQEMISLAGRHGFKLTKKELAEGI